MPDKSPPTFMGLPISEDKTLPDGMIGLGYVGRPDSFVYGQYDPEKLTCFPNSKRDKDPARSTDIHITRKIHIGDIDFDALQDDSFYRDLEKLDQRRRLQDMAQPWGRLINHDGQTATVNNDEPLTFEMIEKMWNDMTQKLHERRVASLRKLLESGARVVISDTLPGEDMIVTLGKDYRKAMDQIEEEERNKPRPPRSVYNMTTTS